MSTDTFIFSVLLLVNASMSLAMLLAARTLGQPQMARLLAAAFGANVLLYAADALYIFFHPDNRWLNVVVCGLAMTSPILMALAYRLRSGLKLHVWRFIAGHALATLAIIWFSFGSPNRGVQGAIVEIYSATALVFAITALWRPGRRLRLGERPIIVTALIVITIGFVGGVIMGSMGNERIPALEVAYTIVIFLALPAATVATGIFSLYLLAGDLVEQLQIAAGTDSLTAAPNRRAIEATGLRMIEETRAAGQPLTVAICDVDHFKDINDLYGHGVGDEVLRRLATLFSQSVGAPHHYGRFGGEEFVLFFPGVGLGDAHARVEMLRDQIMAMRLAGTPVSLTASFGVAAMCPEDRILSDIIKRADRALYASKQAGRNRTTLDTQFKAAS